MRSTIALTVALAVALSSSVAFAGGKKPPEAKDPRTNLVTLPGKKQDWCAINPDCNGWNAWLAQKKKG